METGRGRSRISARRGLPSGLRAAPPLGGAGLGYSWGPGGSRRMRARRRDPSGFESRIAHGATWVSDNTCSRGSVPGDPSRFGSREDLRGRTCGGSARGEPPAGEIYGLGTEGSHAERAYPRRPTPIEGSRRRGVAAPPLGSLNSTVRAPKSGGSASAFRLFGVPTGREAQAPGGCLGLSGGDV